ncbi:hypothetical protein C427_5391 [Paraglaciecola psychrophila 170]|uniref:Uncharacterized protein n=1 Tax=Paraglaciecola psychrophila 170 TaxID=1129794 RepID=M4RXX0_9ALTE|nr:hypothetical protein C427_5391 [Paraglaciecola psychrophila 170]
MRDGFLKIHEIESLGSTEHQGKCQQVYYQNHEPLGLLRR